MILVFFLSFHNSLLWFRLGSFSELSFKFFFSFFLFLLDPTIQKSIIHVLINILTVSEVLEHMFYSIKMANISPFRCPKILFGPFRWHKSFSVFSRTGYYCSEQYVLASKIGSSNTEYLPHLCVITSAQPTPGFSRGILNMHASGTPYLAAYRYQNMTSLDLTKCWTGSFVRI